MENYGQSGPDTLVPVNLRPPADQLYYMADSTHWMIEIPLWIPGLRGALAYGEINIEIGGGANSSGDDGFLKKIFNSATKLDYFMVGRIQHRWDRFYMDADVYGGRIDNSVTFLYNDQSLLDTKIEVIMARLMAGYTFIDHPFKMGQAGRIRSYATAGLQFSYAALDAILPLPFESISAKKSWYDPFIGIGLSYQFYKFVFGSNLNVGFKGIGSFDNWWLSTDARYRIGPRFSVELGWMMNGIGRTRSLTGEDLQFDIRLNGPVAGLSFHF